MQIKRFTAASVREAMQQMRAQLGAEAVILSNQTVGGQVEVVGAVDYDEALLRGALPDLSREAAPRSKGRAEAVDAPERGRAPRDAAATLRPMDELLAMGVASAPRPEMVGLGLGQSVSAQHAATELDGIDRLDRTMADLAGLLQDQVLGALWQGSLEQHPNQKLAARWFTRRGFDPKVAGKLLSQIPSRYDANQALKFAVALLAKRLGSPGALPHETGGIIALCGPPGSGKTAAAVKIAAAGASRFGGNNVTLLSLNNRGIGGQEQLLTYGQLLGINVRAVDGPEGLPDLLDQLAGKTLIIVEGASHWADEAPRQAQRRGLSGLESRGLRVLLTLPAYGEARYLDRVVDRYATPGSSGCIITHLDAAVSPGIVLGTVLEQRLTPVYTTSGPGDQVEIESFDGSVMVRRLIQETGSSNPAMTHPDVMEVNAHGAG